MRFLKIAGNDQVLLQVGYFIVSCPEQLLIENIYLSYRLMLNY